MNGKRKQYSGQFKFKVALEAAKGTKTISELASETGIHPTQIGQWKRQLLEEGAELFSQQSNRQAQAVAKQRLNYMSRLGASRWNLSGWKKKLPNSIEAQRTIIMSACIKV